VHPVSSTSAILLPPSSFTTRKLPLGTKEKGIFNSWNQNSAASDVVQAKDA